MEDFNKDILKKGMRRIWKVWVYMFLSLWSYIVLCHRMEKETPYFKEYGLPLEFIKYGFFGLDFRTFQAKAFLISAIRN